MCNPLTRIHVIGEDQQLREELNGTRRCDAFYGGQPLKQLIECRLLLNQSHGFLGEAIDSPVQMPDVDLNVVGDEA